MENLENSQNSRNFEMRKSYMKVCLLFISILIGHILQGSSADQRRCKLCKIEFK